MVALIPGPVIVLPGRSAQRIQYPPDQLGALRRQVPVDHAGAAERGGQLQAAVGEVPIRVLVR